MEEKSRSLSVGTENQFFIHGGRNLQDKDNTHVPVLIGVFTNGKRGFLRVKIRLII